MAEKAVSPGVLGPNWRFRSNWRGKLILQRAETRQTYSATFGEGPPYKAWRDAKVENMDDFYHHLRRYLD